MATSSSPWGEAWEGNGDVAAPFEWERGGDVLVAVGSGWDGNGDVAAPFEWERGGDVLVALGRGWEGNEDVAAPFWVEAVVFGVNPAEGKGRT